MKFLIHLFLILSMAMPEMAFAKASDVDPEQEGIEDCHGKKGRSKRKCKRSARKAARKLAKENCQGGKKAKCRRKVKRDIKGYAGAYAGIGAKKANKQSGQVWDQYKERKAELDQLLANGEISQEDYNEMLSKAEKDRQNKNFKIGRTKTIKTVAAVGVAAAAVATGGAALGAYSAASAAGAAGAGTAAVVNGTAYIGYTAAGVAASVAAPGAVATGAIAAGGLAAGAGRNKKFKRMDKAYDKKLEAIKQKRAIASESQQESVEEVPAE